MIFSLLLIAANLLPNGSFDQGTAAPVHWERADGLTSFWCSEPGRGRILKLDSRPERKQVLAYQAERKKNPSAPPHRAASVQYTPCPPGLQFFFLSKRLLHSRCGVLFYPLTTITF